MCRVIARFASGSTFKESASRVQGGFQGAKRHRQTNYIAEQGKESETRPTSPAQMSQFIWNSQRNAAIAGDGTAGEPAEYAYDDDLDDDDDETANSKDLGERQKELLVFAIDVSSETMFRPINSNGDVPVIMALKVFASLVESKITRSPSDVVSLVLFGTGRSKSTRATEGRGVYEYSEMEVPDGERVREVDELAEELERELQRDPENGAYLQGSG